MIMQTSGVAGSMPGVQDLSVVVRAGVERAGVVAWEQRNNVTLPQPLKSFYAASDGFKLTWNYATAGCTVELNKPKTHSDALKINIRVQSSQSARRFHLTFCCR